VAGLPPLSGFVSKALIFSASAGSGYAPLLWTVLLLAGLVTLVSMARAGTILFWNTTAAPVNQRGADKSKLIAALFLLLLSPVMSIWADPLLRYCNDTALQLADPQNYIHAVLPESGGDQPQ